MVSSSCCFVFCVFLICCCPDLHVTFICWLRNNPFLDNSAWQAQHHAPLTLIERISNWTSPKLYVCLLSIYAPRLSLSLCQRIWCNFALSAFAFLHLSQHWGISTTRLCRLNLAGTYLHFSLQCAFLYQLISIWTNLYLSHLIWINFTYVYVQVSGSIELAFCYVQPLKNFDLVEGASQQKCQVDTSDESKLKSLIAP